MNENEVIIEIRSQPDERGRQSFSMFWWGWDLATNEPAIRAQGFNAVIAGYVQKWEEKGMIVRVEIE